MATESMNKRKQIENERKKSYVLAGKSALNQSGEATNNIRSNPSNMDILNSVASVPSRGQLAGAPSSNNIINQYF